MFGDSDVGKSSIVNRYITGEFSEKSAMPTIGVDYKIKNL